MKKNLFFFLILFNCNFLFCQQEFIIKEIQILGNKITKEDIILRELSFVKNQPYTKEKLITEIEKSTENLINLRLFNFVNIVESANQERITIHVIERWYIWPYPILEIYERNFNTWWQEFKESNYSDFSRLNYGVFLNWENFRGKNELIKLKIRKGFKEHFLISYNAPYINKEKTIGTNTYIQLFKRKKTFFKTINDSLIYYTNNDKYTSRDYEIYFELFFRKNIHKTHNLILNYHFSNIDLNITLENPYYLNNNNNTGSYSSVKYKFTNENRDYIQYPLNGYYINLEAAKYFGITTDINHYEIISQIEKHNKLQNRLFLGSSFKFKWSSNGYQPYFFQKGLGFDDYVRGYEYYVIDGQNFWLSKTVFKYLLIEKTTFDIPYIKMSQFKKSHYSLFLGLFSDMGYVIDNQNQRNSNLSNGLLWGNGLSIDYVTYYDKLIRIEFSINHLGEKGVFLHFSNPFGETKK